MLRTAMTYRQIMNMHELNPSEIRITLSTLLCVVNGLDNIDVFLSDVFPTEGSALSTGSYALCGRYSGPVNISMMIRVDCEPVSRQFRYVIVRSSDATPENLCIAEFAVYDGSQYAITTPSWGR